FVLALSERWPETKRQFKAWHAGKGSSPFELGQVQFVSAEPTLWVANMIAQHGVAQQGIGSSDDLPPIRYDALEIALSRVADFAAEQGASVHLPRIGCGLAGGTWNKVEPIIHNALTNHGVAVTVYDLPPKPMWQGKHIRVVVRDGWE